MILQELRLHNFGIYRGIHQFDLTPTTEKGRCRPIVLFGGMNGGGKTTLLDAVQLLFFGKRASCSKRGDTSYEEFLKSCINHGVSPKDGASVGLSFLYASEGKEHIYDIDRSWSVSNSGSVREKTIVLKDGELDQWMADNWAHLVDDLVPFGVAQLCFFDAEKVRFLAEHDDCSGALGDAIKALLGLDLPERLIADTVVLESRIARRMQKSDDLAKVEELESSWRTAKAAADRLRQEKASLIPELERAEQASEQTEAEFSRIGGRHWENRSILSQEKAEITRNLALLDDQLVNAAGGSLPLILCASLIDATIRQAQEEKKYGESASIVRLLESRDLEVLHLIEANAASDGLQKSVAEFLSGDRAARAPATNSHNWLELPDVSLRRSEELSQHTLPQQRLDALKAVEASENLKKDLDRIERSLSAAPKEDVLKAVAAQLRDAAGTVNSLRQKIRVLIDELRPAEQKAEELAAEISRLRHKCVDEQLTVDSNARICLLAQRTQTAMRKFLHRATERKIDRLSEKITECFRYLLHKQRLISRVSIDPATFRISLFGESGELLPKERLSEGEKQIFAVSVLWGLSQSSARPLPTIIDTPMGRLDSAHRTQLVSRYFPHASHQVIILSTDTEIERTYFEQLEPFVSRAYHLQYDDIAKRTVVAEGYFW